MGSALALEIGSSNVTGVNIVIPTTTTTWTGNLTNLTELSDTPSSYSGETGNCLKVNAGETGVEFGACGGGGGSGHVHDQDLNTTDDVVFSNLNVTNNITIGNYIIDSSSTSRINLEDGVWIVRG